MRLIAASAVIFAATAPSGAEPPEPKAGPDPAPAAGDEPSRINIFLNGPADLEAVWKALKQPDFVLLKGDELRRMLDGARGTPAGVGPAPAVVDSVAIEGTVGDDRADLAADLGITLAADGPTWVPIRLDDQTVTDAREGGRVLPLQVVGGGWQVALSGRGTHAVRVNFKARPKATADGRQLGFAIPEAASTRFRWDIAQRVVEATAGPSEPVDLEPDSGGSRARLSAHLTPRSRFDVSWRVEAEPGTQLPPLLSIQGEVAIAIDPGSFRTRSTWSIHSVRGSPRILYLLLDPDDEVLELELDGQAMPAGIEKIDGATRMAIALAEPLRPGAPRSLIMTTRRPFPSVPPTLTFRGFPLLNAREQSGAIGIAQGGHLWIGGTPGRGLRRIDPRTELPAGLRARPGTVLGYRFVDQPFELGLRVDASPPLVRTEDRTTVSLDAGQARVDTWLDYQTAHGRPFDVRVGLPRGLELESVGPNEVVESSQLITEPTDGRPGSADGSRVASVRLTPKAQEGSGFSLHLTGRQAIDPTRPVSVALFQPREATSGGGWVAVLADRNLTVDMRDRAGAAEGLGEFRPAVLAPPADWPWPAGRSTSSSGPPALWLRHDGNPPRLPLEVTAHPRTITSETTLLAALDRQGVEVEQEIESTVHFGTMRHLDIEVPAAIRGAWELEGGPVARRDDLGVTAQGDRRWRLTLAGEVADRVKLRFRHRLASAPRLRPEGPTEIAIPWLRPVEGTTAPVRATIAADPTIGLDVAGSGWVRSGDESALSPEESDPPARLVLAATAREPAPLRVVATAHALTPLPPLVASRLWLRTVQGPEGDLRASASYWVETHEGSLSIALPRGAEWVRARVAGEAVAQVEPLPKGAGSRIAFPARLANGPVAVALEYTVPPRAVSAAWVPPRLLDGGLVQQTLWEVRIPWNCALVGVPPGWADENDWYWDHYVWKRRPWRSAAALAAWASGSPARKADDDPEDDPRGDYHSYLFGRPGPPSELRPWIASRAWLVGTCSGSVLALGGLLILFWHPPARLAWAAALALVLAGATAVRPSVTLLAIQSAMVGVAFTLLTALMHRLVHRRRRPAAFGEPSGLATPSGPDSSLSRGLGVGSDDSTAIRVRPSTTVGRVTTPPAAPPEAATGWPSRAERSG
ncbi:MAG TPA: hypothetical protein VKP69_21535 [Isosphaeraceae bacterium]|nr:hypothetical protein [Isosphaeraceae bacterium]